MMDVRDWSLRYYLPRTPHPWITCFVLVLSIYLVISLYLTYDVIPVENVVVRSRIPGALTYDDVTETSKHAIKVGGDSTTRASFTFEGDPAVTDGSRLLPEISQRASKDFDVIEPSPINGVLGSQFVIAQASKFDTPLGDGTEKKAGFSEKSKLDPESFSLQVTSDMIDNFQVKLPPLLEDYKNPCWMEKVPPQFTYEHSFFKECNHKSRGTTQKDNLDIFYNMVLKRRFRSESRWRIRCFPYFFVLGVGKSGTTDLFVTLKTYSKYLSPVYLKEPHYWEWKRCHDRMVCKGKHRNPTFAEYLDTLDPASERIRLETTVLEHGTEYHPLIIGDFTPSTLTFHPCWTNQAGNIDREEPLYMTAHYIRSIRPDAKFIVMMRDPVERIFSNYKMKFRLSKRLGQENAQLFHEEMLNATTYLTNCMLHQTARSCAYSVMKFDYMTHVTNSMYEIFIRDWLAVFPRDQFLFLRMEDYMESRVPNVKAIFEFLGLGELSPDQERQVAESQITNKSPQTTMMYDETRQLLKDFFLPYNRRLAQLLGDPAFSWGY